MRFLRRVLALVILLIVYGSLYPWHFADAGQAKNPALILLHAWDPGPFRGFLRDTVVNVFLYIPLGFSAHLAFRKGRHKGAAIYAPVLLGLLLSATVEMAQVYVPGRQTSMLDVVTNVAGAGLGVLLALLFERLAPLRSLSEQFAASWLADRPALALLFCATAWLFFPLLPVLGLFRLSRKLAILAHTPVLQPAPLISAIAAFYAIALLIGMAAGRRVPPLWLWLTALAAPAQLLVLGRQPAPSFLLGAFAGVGLFIAFHHRQIATSVVATSVEAFAFLGVLVFRGLSPFHLAAANSAFNWTPFAATLSSEWQASASVLLEKIFFYGTAIWMFRSAGMRLSRAVLSVAGTLLAIEIVQIRLPGRTPEITDPLLAILLGFTIAVLARSRRISQTSGDDSGLHLAPQDQRALLGARDERVRHTR